MTVQVADAHAHVRRLVSVLKVATVLECTTEEHSFVLIFLWAKGFNAEDVHKEMLPVHCGKCSSRKAVHNWVEKCSQGRSKVADDGRPGDPVEIMTEATVLRVSTHW
jgi:hypothetical protein